MFHNNDFDRLDRLDFFEFIIVFFSLVIATAFVVVCGWYVLYMIYCVVRVIYELPMQIPYIM